MQGFDADKFAELSKNMTNAQLARTFKLPIDAVLDTKEELRGNGIEIGRGGFPESVTPDYSQGILRFHADNFIVLGDAESPDHDAEMFECAVDIAEKFGIEILFLNGDMIAMDSLSDWRRIFANTIQFSEELSPFKQTLVTFLKRFKQVVELEGNHEGRISHKTDGHVNISQFLHDEGLKNLTYTRYRYVKVTSCGMDGKGPDQEWLICHQDNYSKIPLSVPRLLVQVYHMNIICAHNHRQAKGMDLGNRYWLIEGGHCRDTNRTLYKIGRINTHPVWQPGFTLVLDGYPWLVDKHNYRQFLRGVIGKPRRK